MNRTITILLFCLFTQQSWAQLQMSGSSIHYNNGNVGVGTTYPIGKLHIVDDAKNYYVNRIIPGTSDDAKSINYLLLHEAYVDRPLEEHYVVGKVFGERGAINGWNRKWVVDVSTASACESNRGSIISYNEYSRLVTLWYGGKKYIAAEISKNSSLYSFSFTGYACNEELRIVTANEVYDVQHFIERDPVVINGGDLTVWENVGVGTPSPEYKLDVVGTIRAHQVIVNTQKGADFVFEDSYNLRSLEEVEQFISQNKHLPDITPASTMAQEGVDMGEMQIQLLQKMEEMTLYMIELKKENSVLKQEMKNLKMMLDR